MPTLSLLMTMLVIDTYMMFCGAFLNTFYTFLCVRPTTNGLESCSVVTLVEYFSRMH